MTAVEYRLVWTSTLRSPSRRTLVSEPMSRDEALAQFDASQEIRRSCSRGRGWLRVVAEDEYQRIAADAAHMAELSKQVLARFAEELAQALGADELLHLARRAEGLYATDLGRQMRELVDAERYRRIRKTITLHMHTAACRTTACDGASSTDYSRADEVMLLLGWEPALQCMRRWEAVGYTCDWRDLAYGPTADAR